MSNSVAEENLNQLLNNASFQSEVTGAPVGRETTQTILDYAQRNGVEITATNPDEKSATRASAQGTAAFGLTVGDRTTSIVFAPEALPALENATINWQLGNTAAPTPTVTPETPAPPANPTPSPAPEPVATGGIVGELALQNQPSPIAASVAQESPIAEIPKGDIRQLSAAVQGAIAALGDALLIAGVGGAANTQQAAAQQVVDARVQDNSAQIT